jgi:preprotein translocase subunit Sec61beta
LPTNLSLKKKVLPKKEKNKMADEKIQMPSGIGGLVRYFDDYKSKIEIPNMVFIAFCVLVIIFYLYLHFG